MRNVKRCEPGWWWRLPAGAVDGRGERTQRPPGGVFDRTSAFGVSDVPGRADWIRRWNGKESWTEIGAPMSGDDSQSIACTRFRITCCTVAHPIWLREAEGDNIATRAGDDVDRQSNNTRGQDHKRRGQRPNMEHRAGFEPAIRRLCRPLPSSARAPMQIVASEAHGFGPVAPRAWPPRACERATGLEPATFTLARWRSTN